MNEPTPSVPSTAAAAALAPKRQQRLVEFQRELSQRLQRSREQGTGLPSRLHVQLGEHFLSLNLADTGELLPPQALTKVPFTQAWFLGIASVRGQILGVVDWAAWCAQHAHESSIQALLAPLLATSPTAVTGNTPTTDTAPAYAEPIRWLCLASRLGLPVALQVRRVFGLHEHHFEATANRPSDAPLVQDSYVHQDRTFHALDLRVLAQHPSFRQIVAPQWLDDLKA